MPYITDNMAEYLKCHWGTEDEVCFCKKMHKKHKLEGYIKGLQAREIWFDKIGTSIDMGAVWDTVNRLKGGC